MKRIKPGKKEKPTKQPAKLFDPTVSEGDDEEKITELETALAIDKHALDEALLIQPDCFHRVSENLEMAISRRDAAKQYVNEVESAADAEIRQWAIDNEEKLTEAQITAKKVQNEDVKAANRQYLRLKHIAARWSGLERAFGERSHALHNLCKLYVAGYFGGDAPRVSERALKDHMAEQNKRELNTRRRKGEP